MMIWGDLGVSDIMLHRHAEPNRDGLILTTIATAAALVWIIVFSACDAVCVFEYHQTTGANSIVSWIAYASVFGASCID